MIKKIVRGQHIFKTAEKASQAHRQVVTDLMDTLRVNLDHCHGIVI